jgi:hypothetical protein
MRWRQQLILRRMAGDAVPMPRLDDLPPPPVFDIPEIPPAPDSTREHPG